MGFWDTLAKKLPTMRGVVNYFYVAANWSRISEEQEAYRRQIRDREEWAKQALAMQAELHELALARTLDVARRWRDVAVRAGDTMERNMERAFGLMDTMKAEIERRGEVTGSLTVIRAQVLAREQPPTRALLMGSLDEDTRDTLTELIARIVELRRALHANDSDALPP